MRLALKRRSACGMDPEHLPLNRQELVTESGSLEVVRLGQGEPIVLVPGLAGGWPLLFPLARRLASKNEVILIGLNGDRDLVPRPRDEGLGEHARGIASALERLGIERPAVLGVSFGGAVALELAVEYPSRIGALIVQGAEARFQRLQAARIARRVLERFPLPSDNAFLNQFFNLLHGRRTKPGPLVDFVLQRCWETDQGVMAARLRALENFDVSERLWKIEAPTLVLAGGRDLVVTPKGHRALALAIGGARFRILPEAGHLGFLTSRQEIAREVRRHLRLARRTVC